MRLCPSEEQRAFEEGLRRALGQTSSADDEVQWKKLAELGITGLGIAEELGGSGGGPDEIAIVARLLGEAGWRTPFSESVAYVGAVVAGLAGPGHEDLLRGLASGNLRVAPVTDHCASGFTVRREGDGFRLSGGAALVPAGSAADAWLIEARDGAGDRLALWAPRGTAGISAEAVDVVDGSLAADLRFENAWLPAKACLGSGEKAEAVLHAAGALHAVTRLWTAAADVEQLVRLTLDHVRTRQQFGQPLAGFQAIQHRAARMSVLAGEARAAALYAQAEHAASPRRRDRAISSAFVRIAEVGEQVSREAVQLHGAMGFTQECAVSGHFKALFAFRHGGRGLAWHERRLAAILREPGEAGRSLVGGAGAADKSAGGLSLALDPAEQAFVEEVRHFLEGAVDEGIRRGARLTVGVFPEPDVAGPWHRLLFRQGWIAPYLPPSAGGTGWTRLQAHLFEHECAASGAPSLQLQGLRMLAPVLLRYGTTDQIDRYLPAILSGESLWCQGYSEPEAGSDLASLRTRAVLDGDDYVINGAKIWTTQAQFATHMFALVRTSTEGRRQDGISFLLIDMKTFGITVRPIRTIAGEQEINEVFFDNVRVPRANLVGTENGGWECAKYLLDFERGGSTVSGPLRAYFARALAQIGDDSLDARVAATGAALDAIEMGELTGIALSGKGKPGHVETSALKLRMAEVRQQIGAIAAESLGADALRWPAARPLHHQPARDVHQENKLAVVPNHFNDLAYSIFAGSSEIQLSIIAGALGLRGGRQ